MHTYIYISKCISNPPLFFHSYSIGPQLDGRGDDGTVRYVFSICLSSTIAFTPLIGFFLDRYGFSPALAVINTLLALSSVLILIPVLEVHIRVNPDL